MSRVRVAVRLRPLLPTDHDPDASAASLPSSCVRASAAKRTVALGAKTFAFDRVFGADATQAEVFRGCAADLVERALAGENVTILAYGQTGSGKSHSMGTAATGATANDMESGIIPRFLNGLFNGLRRSVKSTNSTEIGKDKSSSFSTRVAFLEIYNEKLIDLLGSSAASSPSESTKKVTSSSLNAENSRNEKLVIVRERSGAMSVRGLTELPVDGCGAALELLHAGGTRRQTASTLMNSESSRSHAIFQVMVTRRRLVTSAADSEDGEDRFVTTTSKVSLVDLAGSERLKRTGAEGLRQREGISINYGLSVLGNVIKALCNANLGVPNSNTNAASGNDAASSTASADRADHVPYRESLLTRLLQDSLGGNSRTLFLACLSPSHKSADETMNTLRYANRAKNIKNNVTVNISAADRKLMSMQRKVCALQNALVWQRFGREPHTNSVTADGTSTAKTSTEAAAVMPNIGAIQDLLSRSDVKDYLKSITGSSAIATTIPRSIPGSIDNGGIIDASSGSAISARRGDAMVADEIEQGYDHGNEEEMEMDQEAALDVMDRILEMERAKQQHHAELSSETTELQSVEGELTSKMALLSRLREKLQARDAWFQRMETERAKLELDLEHASKAARAAKQEKILLQGKRKGTSKGGKKGKDAESRRSAKALEKARELESHVTKLRRKLIQNQKALRAMRRRQADEGALESQITSLKRAKARILRSQRERETRHGKAQKRREQELQALRRKQRSDVRSLTRLKVVNRNQKGILDRRAALLKRNQIALRNTRKQVVTLLRQQQQKQQQQQRQKQDLRSRGSRHSRRRKRKNHILAAIQGGKECSSPGAEAECDESKANTDSLATDRSTLENTEAVGTKFRLIENHVSSMARMQCLRDDLNEELAAKETCVADLVSILSSDVQSVETPSEDDAAIAETSFDDSLVDSLQLKISMVDERVRAISEEMQALEMSKSIHHSQLNESSDAAKDTIIDSVVSSMNVVEARAIVHMLVIENTRLQGNMMTDVRQRQRERQEWRQREQRAHSRRLAAEHVARDLRLKMDLWRLEGKVRPSRCDDISDSTDLTATTGTEKTVSECETLSKDDECDAQIELRMVQDEHARLEGEARLSYLSSKSHEADAKSECADVLSSCSQLWDNLGVPWKEREADIMRVESSYRNQSEALLAELQTKERDVRAHVQALEEEKEQLCEVLGRKNRASRRVREKFTLLSRLQMLREVVEPMRMEVSERTFVLSVQRERVAGLSRALCQEEENEELFASAAGLDDDSVAQRDSLLRTLLRRKSRADIQVHSVLEKIRTQIADLAKNCSPSTLPGSEATRLSEGGRGRSSDVGGRDSATAMIFNKEIAPLLRTALCQLGDSDSAIDDALSSIYSVVVAKQTSPGCDERSIHHLVVCHKVVAKIHSSVSSVATKVRHLLSQVRAATAGESNHEEADTSEEGEVMQSSLTDTMDLLAGLESAVSENLIYTVEENIRHVSDLWDELGTDASLRLLPTFEGNNHVKPDNTTSTADFKSFVACLSMRTDWETGNVHGAGHVEQCLAYSAAILSLKQSLHAQFESTEHLRKMAAKIVEMETKAQSFETGASDKNRLRAGGSRLLEEERFRRHFVKAYPQMLNKIISETEAWEKEYKLPLRIKAASALVDTKDCDERVEEDPEKTCAAARLLLGARKVLAAYQEVLAGSRVHKEQALTLGDFLIGKNQSDGLNERLSIPGQRRFSAKNAGEEEEADERDDDAEEQDSVVEKTSSWSPRSDTSVNQENNSCHRGRIQGNKKMDCSSGTAAKITCPLTQNSLNSLAPQRKLKNVLHKVPKARRCARSRKNAGCSSVPGPSSKPKPTSKPCKASSTKVMSRLSASSECRSPRVAKTSRMVAERRASATARNLESIASAEEALAGKKKKVTRSKRRTNLRDLFG